MKIIHIYDGHERVFPGEGSVPSIVYFLAKYSAKEGHDVTVLERRWKKLDYNEQINGVKFARFDLNICSNISNEEIIAKEISKLSGFSRLIVDRTLFMFRSNEYLKKTDFDAIHVHLPFAASLLVTINRKIREKIVYTAHVGEERKRFALDPSAPLMLKLFSPDLYLMKRIKKNIVLNNDLKSKLISKGIKEDRLEVIPNGIEVREFGCFNDDELKSIREKYGLVDKFVVMYAGTITPRKGIETLVKAGEAVLNQGDKNVVFLLCGNLNIDKDFRVRIMDFVKKKSLDKNIVFMGFIPYKDLKVLYSACNIFVLPSFEEGDPIALKEALASGKPLIASKVGGIPIQIKDGWNGFLVKPGDERQLAEKIKDLINNSEERERMGRNSSKLAEDFDWKKIAERYLEIYEEVVI